MTRTLLLALLAVAACKSDGPAETAPPTGGLSGCDPTDPAICAMPYPSGYFQVADPSTPSGVRNAFGIDALPANRDHFKLDPALMNERDGFSFLTPMVTYFEDLSPTGLIGHQDLEAYLAADATTVILNADTGERLPHFAELDVNAPEDLRSLVIHPVTPMARGTRYVVGIRNLVHNDGSPVQPSPAFAGLRDGDTSAHPDLPQMVDRYEQGIFPVLEAAGFPRDELLLAWDFTTGSRENLHRDMVTIRDDAFARLPADGPEYAITSVELGDCAAGDTIAKTIEGTVTVPMYTDVDAPGAILVRDADGVPTYNGTVAAEFLIRVPCSLAEDPSQASMILQYGHGLLGDRYEARTGWLSSFANDNRMVVLGMDWTGMSERDAPTITLMLAYDLSGFRMIPERTEQGFVEFAVGMRMMQTSIVDDPELSFGGVPILDGAPVGYYGNSQGGILGGAYMAISPDIERGVLGVVGGPYSLLLPRSSDFGPFFLLFKEKYTDHRDITLLLAAMQTLWDPGEPGGYVDALTSNPLPGTPAKQVLLQVALGDSQVTTLGAHVLARAIGAPTVAPQTRPLFGITEAAPGFSGSALVEFAYTDVPHEPVVNVPADVETDTHECPRREIPGQAQVVDFLLDGVVNQYCDGPCVGVRAGLCD